MRPEVLLIASIGCVGISALVMVIPFTLPELIPRQSGCLAMVGGFCGNVVSLGLGLWIHAFYGMPEERLGVWWWVGGVVLLAGIVMLTHGVVRRRVTPLLVGALAVVVAWVWQ